MTAVKYSAVRQPWTFRLTVWMMPLSASAAPFCDAGLQVGQHAVPLRPDGLGGLLHLGGGSPVGLGHVVEQARPDPLGVLPDGACGLGHRHAAAGQEQGHQLHEQGESALQWRPRHLHPPQARSGAALHPRHVGVLVALELEEVQVASGATLAVIDRAGLADLGMPKAASGRDIHLHVEPLETPSKRISTTLHGVPGKPKERAKTAF